mgnify:CR=1 FL=1
MAILSPDTWQFICAHRTEDVRTLALQARKYPQVDMAAAVVQITGWQIAEKKVPLWAQTEGVQYPAHLSMEQCSSFRACGTIAGRQRHNVPPVA